MVPPDLGSLVGRPAVDVAGHRLGTVVAIIHKADGADVLIEGRGWWRRRSRRVGLDALVGMRRGSVIIGDADFIPITAELRGLSQVRR